jgi:F0F1-type ATP synthase assembly protein I
LKEAGLLPIKKKILLAALIVVVLAVLALVYLQDPGVSSLVNILAYLLPAVLIFYVYLTVSRR